MVHVISPLNILDDLREDVVDGPVTYNKGSVTSINGPVCYVGGLAVNVNQWIYEAIEQLDEIDVPIITTGTVRSTPEHPLSVSLIESWDHNYLQHIKEGVGLLWVPEQHSWSDQGRGLYAKGARRVIKTLIGMHQLRGLPVSLGMAREEDVSEGLLYSIREDYPEIPLAHTLEHTVQNARTLLYESR